MERKRIVRFLLCIISILTLSLVHDDSVILKGVHGATLVASTTCSDGEFYNSATLECESCPDNYLVYSDGLSCYCPRHYELTGTSKPETCTPCGSGEAANFIQNDCKPCDGSTCVCANDQFLQEYNGGENLRCVACPKGYYSVAAGNPVYYCEKCPLEGQIADGGSCTCEDSKQAQSTFCVDGSSYSTVTNSYNPATSISVLYDPIVTGSGGSVATVSSSDTFSYLLPQALYECLENKDNTQCNILANLCVYQMYDETEAPCLAFRNMLSSVDNQENTYYDSGWREGLPWLYYVSSADDVIENNERIQGRVEFQSSSDSTLGFLRFVVSKFSLEGAFLGYEDLTTQLQLCYADYDYGRDYRHFGETVKSSCSFDVNKLIDSNLQPNNTDVFYELWLVDTSGNYIDVPVKIKNYRDSSGDNPNESSSRSKWKLTRRFFIYDTKSGIEGSNAYANGGTYSSYIRWLHKVRINIEVDTSGDDQIYVPYVELEYKSKALAYIPDSSQDTVSFSTKYKMDSENFWIVAWIFFAIINVMAIFVAGFKVYCWCRRHPSQLMGSVYTFKLIYKILFYFCQSWSSFMFWYLFSLSASLYAFFKLASSPYLILFQDEDNNFTPWVVIFCFVIIFKLAVILCRVLSQSFCSVYVLDREKNMSNFYATLTNALQQARSDTRDFYARQTRELDEPKAWRPIFVMNELNELLMSKIIHVEPVLLWTLFLIQGQGWEWISEYEPSVSTNDTRSPESYIIMYFIFTLTIAIIGLVIYIIRNALTFVFPPSYLEFEDLCAVSNISLFIFDEKFHGYYIHGESPALSADVNLGVLKKALDREGEGASTYRGLVEARPTLQTYEFYVPYALRKTFDQVFEENKEMLKHKRGDEEAYKKKNKKVDFIYKSKEMDMYEEDFRKIISKRDEMDYFLVNKLQEIKRNPQKFIPDVSFLYGWFRLPPQNVMELNDIILTPDRLKHFTRVLLLDLDFEILWFMSLFLTAMDAAGLHVLASGLIFYIIYVYIIRASRQMLGEGRLASTSGVDSKFLI